ncbi:MAG: UDP-N-acetylglucosamine 1-carboxyvinyltransferase [Deltaproteobacteria bacterium]|nr:UDP-N-acetylglucosamine 1-carboxyvinyltransferase [Candidatus Anaeroferrophillus wilburensis]MBN2888643.1 UDP-N-acetylglucosamine 1-carboxyvinyltransferase [Deltaproteobacteria bacterium]
MDTIIVRGGQKLAGEVVVSGAKNAALPILAASLLVSEGRSRFANIPCLRDIATISSLLETMGAELLADGERLEIDTSGITSWEAPYELVKTMRASILVLGPLLARFGEARVSLPGGCAIGARPVNLHIHGLEMMGADITVEHGYIHGRAARLHGADITFDLPTVTGTENLMMAATLARGTTVLRNAAREPEIIDLANCLQGMGARISGAGTATISIEGVEKLRPADYAVMPDRIEAATFMIAGGLTGGKVIIKNCPLGVMGAEVGKLQEAGLKITPVGEVDPRLPHHGIDVQVAAGRPLCGFDVKTMPFPGFPTDVQAQIMVLACLAAGTSVITETVFENRFMHVFELQRMGADIELEGRSAIIKGVTMLSGAPVMASDLRASASLVLAGLAAEGETRISRVYHLDRGYFQFEKKLQSMGADIWRVPAGA